MSAHRKPVRTGRRGRGGLRSALRLEPLEPRVLLSAAPGTEVLADLSVPSVFESSALSQPLEAQSLGAIADPASQPTLLGQTFPSDYDQYLLELINRGRADPQAEADRYEIDLNEGLTPGTITTDPKQPLALNLHIIDAAHSHSQWMLDNNSLSHIGPGDDSPGDRMEDAGYGAQGSFGWGENIAWMGHYPSVPDLGQATAELHESLFVDDGYLGRGHRVNLMAGDFKEVGTGVLAGTFTQGGTDYNAVMVTEDFAYKFDDPFLTGVAYDDAVTDDDFYTPGEGLGGVTVTAERVSDGAQFTATTWDSGGYSLQVPTGTYDVTATGGALGGPVVYRDVVVAGENVKLDYTPDQAAPPGFVTVEGTGFAVDGEPFYAPGTNCYYLMQFAADPHNRVYVDEVLEEAADLGLKTIRTWGFYDGSEPNALQFAPGVYNETTFVGLDYVVHKASQLGLRLIVPFVNYWDAFGGMDQYVAWDAVYGQSQETAGDRIDFYTDPDTRGWYQDHVAAVVNRVNTFTGVAYRDDPTIMAWELANEPRNAENTGSLEPLQGWIEDMAAYVKGIDPHHLLSTGVEGFYFNQGQHWLYSGWMGADFVTNHDVAGIDFATCHVWPQNWGIDNAFALQWVDDHIVDAHNTLGMPLLIEEFGQFRTTDQPPPSSGDAPLRDELYQGIFDRVAANNVAGWNYWTAYHDRYPDFDHYGVYDRADSETLTRIAAAASPGPGPFSISGTQFLRYGQPTFLHVIGYQPLKPGQDSDDPLDPARIQDDLRRLAAFRGGEPLALRTYAQPTAALPVRLSEAFYDGVRELDLWVIRDVWFDPDYMAADAVSKGQAAIDAVIGEVQAAGGLDRIFAWEFANEFSADSAIEIATLESFLGDMCDYLKQEVAALPVADSDWVTWASWPPSDPLHTDGNPIVLDCWDFHSHNVYSYEPVRIRDHQAGPATGTPFAGYLAALADAYADRGLDKPLVLSETGYPDSPSAVPGHADFPPWAPQYQKGGMSGPAVAEALADRYWDARLSGAVDGFGLFEWNDEWWKAGTPDSQDHPEEYFGILGFDPVSHEAYAKLQLDTVRTLYSLHWAPDLVTLSADDPWLYPGETTTVRATLSPDLAGDWQIRWEASRGTIIGDAESDAVEFYAGDVALGPATVTAVVYDADRQASQTSVVIDIEPQDSPSIELLTLGSDPQLALASGRVANVNLDEYKIVCYIETDSRYVQPYADMTSIFVRPDGYWWTPVNNASDGDLVACLVPIDYEPVQLPAGQDPPGAIVSASLTASNDSDNDLLPDQWEEQYFGSGDLTEDRWGDFDGDLANHLEEFLAGTAPDDPWDNDSEGGTGDGLPDNWERRYFGHLAYGAGDDPENDGFDNTTEWSAGLHPGRTAVDTDGDWLPDRWEIRSFGTLATEPDDPLPDGTVVWEAYELGRPLPVETVAFDDRAMVTGRLNPDAPGPRSLTLLDIQAHRDPPGTLYAFQLDGDWLQLANSGGPLFRDDVQPAGAEPEWHTAAEWLGTRLRGLEPDTEYTVRAAVNTGFNPAPAAVVAATVSTTPEADVNASGLPTALDYAYARAALARGESIGTEWHWSLDVDDSGTLDEADLTAIHTAILGPQPVATGGPQASPNVFAAAALASSSRQATQPPAARLSSVWAGRDRSEPWQPPDDDDSDPPPSLLLGS